MLWLVIDIHCLFLRFLSRLTKIKILARLIAIKIFNRPAALLNLLTYDDADLHEQLTMRAVFLHVLGDTVSSVSVIISALLIKFVEDDNGWKHLIDPIARQPLF